MLRWYQDLAGHDCWDCESPEQLTNVVVWEVDVGPNGALTPQRFLRDGYHSPTVLRWTPWPNSITRQATVTTPSQPTVSLMTIPLPSLTQPTAGFAADTATADPIGRVAYAGTVSGESVRVCCQGPLDGERESFSEFYRRCGCLFFCRIARC